ncbi:carbohydrate ABC transporter permease [Peribacillus muralis]|uniref:carbohydrate ABC transporter permease n=1 Tax=Peribacillus muralis TaxID=264697 RepID=UPI001F4E7E82|nr:carbohydrate ABC transporter permease [Peribacillus muralis]MCK1993291.1 carbohydrate ABC transporter permease [Peribacillus muralis]MCK2013845.1 carbohydrate ABC transporter permease [Peribacillus muralis]
MKQRLPSFMNYTFLFLITLTMLLPVLNILALSLTDPAQVSKMNGLDIWPKGFTLINYKALLSNPQVGMSILNSIFITVVGTFINLLLTAMAAYVLTRPNFVGKRFFMVLLIIMMVFEPGLIQEYLVVKDLGLLNTYTSVLLYKAVDVYYLIILMRFFEEVPETIIEAARIDGAGHFRIFTKIMLPLSKPALATLCLFYGVFHWNEFFRASIYLSEPEKWPLQLLLRQFVVLNDTTAMLGVDSMLSYNEVAKLEYASLSAGTIIISIIPLLLLYPLILKFYTKGNLEGGVKD